MPTMAIRPLFHSSLLYSWGAAQIFSLEKKTWPPSPLVAEKLAVRDLLTVEKTWNEGDDSNAPKQFSLIASDSLAGFNVWTFHLQTLRCLKFLLKAWKLEKTVALRHPPSGEQNSLLKEKKTFRMCAGKSAEATDHKIEIKSLQVLNIFWPLSLNNLKSTDTPWYLALVLSWMYSWNEPLMLWWDWYDNTSFFVWP